MRTDRFFRTALITLLAEASYMLWLGPHVVGIAGAVYFCLEASLFALFLLFLFNHDHRQYAMQGGPYSLRAYVDIFVPTVNEPVAIVRKTLQAARAIPYPNKTIYVLDDGNRPTMRKLAAALSCVYVTRPNAREKRYKAANLNYGLAQSRGTFILTLDADHAVRPEILDDLLGHFKNPQVAFVATRQGFAIPDSSFNNDHTFYEYMQSGKNADNAAISCGSGVIYRRTALEKIGGFQEWNLVEDLYTSFVFHEQGYQSVYSSQRYSKGHAPEDLPTICKQRWVWAYDTLRLFFWKPALAYPSLSLRQRLHYFEIGYGYLVSALTVPSLAIFNTWVLIANKDIISNWPWFFVLKVISFGLILYFYETLDQGTLSSRMWASLFPVYTTAALRALWYPKPLYKPTPKRQSKKPAWIYIVPHCAILAALLTALVYHLVLYGPTVLIGIHLFWFLILIYWFTPIIKLGFPRRANTHETTPPHTLSRGRTLPALSS